MISLQNFIIYFCLLNVFYIKFVKPNITSNYKKEPDKSLFMERREKSERLFNSRIKISNLRKSLSLNNQNNHNVVQKVGKGENVEKFMKRVNREPKIPEPSLR